jgi:hypothetical protein
VTSKHSITICSEHYSKRFQDGRPANDSHGSRRRDYGRTDRLIAASRGKGFCSGWFGQPPSTGHTSRHWDRGCSYHGWRASWPLSLLEAGSASSHSALGMQRPRLTMARDEHRKRVSGDNYLAIGHSVWLCHRPCVLLARLAVFRASETPQPIRKHRWPAGCRLG